MSSEAHIERKPVNKRGRNQRIVTLFATMRLLEGLGSIPFIPHQRRERFLRSAAKRRGKIASQFLAAQRAVVDDNGLSLSLGKQSHLRGVEKDGPETGEFPTSLFGLTSLHDFEHGRSTGVARRPLHTDLESEQAAGRILVVCKHAPTISHAGGLRILDILHKIKNKHSGAYIEIFTSHSLSLYGPMSEALQIADRVVLAQKDDFCLAEYMRQTAELRAFDVIDFQFPQPIEVVEEYRKIGRKLIFTPMESHIRNEAIIRGTKATSGSDLTTLEALQEAAICQIVDQVVCVSSADCDAISACVPCEVLAIETGVSEIEFSTQSPPSNPNDKAVCFVAYFGSETNRAALRWYLDEVHPHVADEVPDYEFRIVGRGDVSDILSTPATGIRYIGEVERVAPHVAAAAVGIAPALGGSGFRGKINQYAKMEVPTVANSLAAEGFAYTHGESILVADDPAEFAACIVRLLRNPEARRQMGVAAAAICRQVYGWESRWPQIADVYDLPPAPEVLALPSVHAVVPSYRHAAYIEERLRSVFAQEYANLRVTVIDDHSQDGSHEVIERMRREHDFNYVRRERNSGSPFSAWQYAADNTSEDLIWICESDDSCDPLMIGRLVRQLTARRSAKIAYCASEFINESGEVIGWTDTYFAKFFHPTRWLRPFIARGLEELRYFQRFGMVVPNMSSVLVDAEVFRAAFTPDVKDYRLAGDWLFVGRALQFGDIVYIPERLNRFRKHENTARFETQEPRRLAEHVSVRLKLSALAGSSETETLAAVKYDLRRLAAHEELLQAALDEMESFDAVGAQQLRELIQKFYPGGNPDPQLAELFY
jgi:glycosyltransferase involved in cell wall biosynthesis